MYFKKLEMHGFKSFAEPVTIEFDDGVTCIVGPNGSGKSNISDALRWVLGEQSSKMLRGGRMEDVIFAGTANRKSRGMAEVTLVIDNTTGILPIEYNEVAITRRMFRSGESEYLINNNHCRLRDIRELIMDTGIGVDGYSLIGQGKIADIVSNKPESRREIFEEAAGIVMYKSKKADAERKLEGTNANLERVNDIISEIEGRIEGLREDSIKAKEYLSLRDRYKELEINITLKNIETLDLKLEEMKDDILELSGQLEEGNSKKQELDGRINEDRNHIEDLQSLSNKAKEDLLTKINEINALTNQDQLNSERLATIERDIDRLGKETEQLKAKIQIEDNNKASMLEGVAELKEQLDDINEKLLTYIDYYNQISSQSIELFDGIEEKKTELFNLNTSLISMEGEIKSMENLKDTLIQRKSEIQEEQRSLHDDGNKLQLEIDKLEKQVKELEEDKNTIIAQGKNLVKEQSELLDSQRKTKQEIDDIRIKKSQLSSRMKTIEEMENNYEGYNYAVKYIMKSNLKGINGVVADLMEVPRGLEVAIETALGSAMQNIVCQDDNSAKTAVNALKANKAGRLTFLPINSLRAKAADVSAFKNSKGVKGLAADLISFDSKYLNVFTYLLGRVMIVDTMENAIELSKGNKSGIRFVTLDGEIINVSGAITGGKYKNNTANLLERKGEVSKLKNEISRLEEMDKECNETSIKLEEKLAKVKNQIQESQVALKDTEIQYATSLNSLQSMKELGNQHENSQNKFQRELTNIDQDFAKSDKMIETLKNDIEAGKEKIASISVEIENSTAEYEELKKSSEEASENITKTRIDETELTNKIDGLNNIIQRIDGSISDYEFQVDFKEKESEKLLKEKNNILFGSDDVEKEVTEKTREKENLEGYIKEVDAEINQLGQKVKEDANVLEEINNNLSSFGSQKYELEIKLAKGETQLEGYKSKLWDEFEISYIQAMDFKKKDFVMSTSLKECRDIKNKIKDLGEVNISAIKEYAQVGERYEFLTEQRADVEKAKQELETIISEMETTIKQKFKENFDQVVVNFETIFKELFGGGHAELRLEDADNPLETGIEIVAQPPGKKLQNINLLSGGEKTMTAIALMFAVLKTKPTPFCILDEVEAALDEANIDRFANYLKQFNEIQFALITHQKVTMEHADVLYGVTMPERGISKVLSLKLEDDFEL